MSVRFVPLAVVALLAATIPVVAQQKSIYRDGFAGRNPTFLRGDANVRFDEKDHKMSAEHGHSGLSSESIKIEANPPAGAADVQFVDYYYQTPPAPVTDRLTASVWVKAFRAGIQIKARVVFPKEKDPRNPNAPLTTLIAGGTYTQPRRWQRLDFGDVADVVKKQLPVLHARLGRAVDPSDAYLDRVVLNVFAGPGVTELWIDDLEIGPVRTDLAPPSAKGQPPGATASRPNRKKALPVEFTEGQIAVDGQPFLMLAIRHTGTPLKTLHDAGFNTVWFPTDPPPATVEDAVRHGFWVVPSLPLPAGQWVDGKPKQADADTLKRDADSVAAFLRRFIANDAVLMWSLGSGRTLEDLPRVARASELVRTYDPRRPRAVDLWDGYSAYSSYVNAMGAHRWPLFSSLEMRQYRQWLSQRKALIPPGKLAWTWVQTHLPEWFAEKLCGQPDPAAFDDPIGPHPEQLRILTYLSLAAGYRGLGFWSDKYLENACHGRDRLLELALLNSEIEMLRPVLLSASDPAKWRPTDNGNVQAAVIRGGKEILVLPVWLGYGSQYTPAQAALPSLTVVIPAVPDSAVPWLVTPVGVTELKGVKRVAGGTEIVIPEFDTTAAVVFTSDQCGPQSQIVRWQDHTRFKLAPLAARWAQQQAIEQYRKTRITHDNILKAGGPDLPNGEAPDLFRRSAKYIASAKAYAENNQFDQAYYEARRALRPLRVLMRADWQKAVETLDVPTASPFAVSFYSLPRHWKFAQQVQASRPAGNAFPNGGFELSQSAPKGGAAVSSLPGWRVRKMILDPGLTSTAAIINVNKDIVDQPPRELPMKPTRYAPLRVAPHPVEFRQPEFGRHCLAMQVGLTVKTDKEGKPVPQPQAVERVVLAVDSAPAEFAPGSLVRISFWAKVPGTVATADGLVVFDSAGGEPLGARILSTIPELGKPAVWRQYHLYRRVPPSGKVAMTFALTGLGIALIDDVRIEPLVPGAAVDAAYCPPLATKPTVAAPVRQAGYQQQPKEATRSRDR
jgi:hypothetical protein